MLNFFNFFKIKCFLVLLYNYFFFYNYILFFFKNNLTFGFYFYFLLACLFTFFFIFFINRFFFLKNKKILLLYFFFLITIFYLMLTDSFFLFFILYEFLLFLSAFLFKISSQNKRSYSVLIYFVLWTQMGSFLVLIGFSYIFILTNSTSFFFLKNVLFSENQKSLIFFLFFIGFGVKLPLWPFSFWLSKTHVEANTSFSIFLSSVLLKTACIGIFKLNFFFENNFFFFFFLILSFVFSSFNFIIQVDFKKLIAYSTIQEMSILFFFLTFQDFFNFFFLKMFILVHTFTTIQLFFLNDILYKKFSSRLVNTFYGFLNTTPKLSVVFLLSFFFFTSIPFFFKFFLEVLMLFKFLNRGFFFFCVFVVFVQYIGILFFSKLTLPFLFGKKKAKVFDLCSLDFFLLSFLILLTYLLFMLNLVFATIF